MGNREGTKQVDVNQREGKNRLVQSYQTRGQKQMAVELSFEEGKSDGCWTITHKEGKKQVGVELP